MKNSVLIIALFCCAFTNSVYGQRTTVFRTSEAFIFGEYEDSIVKGVYRDVIIKLNTTTSEMKIILFNDELETNSALVDSIFGELTKTFSLELTIDPNSYEDKENVLDNTIYRGNVLVSFNGVIKVLMCEYTIHILKTNNPYLKEMKLTLNLIIPLADFDIDDSNGLSEEIEIEITHGVINQ